jgi:hypothetical protein
MMLLLLLTTLPVLRNDGVIVGAELRRSALEPGRTGALALRFELADGWTAEPNPLLAQARPMLFIQLAPPAGIAFSGPTASELPELLGSAFLDLPHERVVAPGETEIEFVVRARPPADARLAFNALIYVRAPGAGARAVLVRKRFELRLSPGAVATEVASTESGWGGGDALRLGERLDPFALPGVSGTLALAELQDGPFLVLTTQRSCL